MVTECRPLRESGGLPPRRSELIQAAATPQRASDDWGSSINVSQAKDRLWEYFEREQGPSDVRSSLSGAMNGDIRLQHLLFSAMLDTWPKLQKAINEMARRVVTEPWSVIPHAERGEEPDEKAQQLAKEIEIQLWSMRPRPERNEAGLEATIRNLVFGYYYGHGVQEIRWHQTAEGWSPRCTKQVPSRFYGYPADPTDQEDDRLLFYETGQIYGASGIDFPEHRFLIAINAGHATHPAMSAPLRALAPYWLAAVYGLKWMMNFTQLYGIPWRHAEVADVKDEAAVRTALANIGSLGYIVTKSGTKINVLDSAKSGDAVPQKVLIDLADQQCDQFILGQTLTGGTDKSGSRALGEVHQNTLSSAVRGLADFVGGILSHQLIPSIVALNYGGSRVDQLPEMWAKHEKVNDEKALAERDEKIGITTGKVQVGKAWFYERHGIPMPAAGEEMLMEEPETQDPELGPDGKPLTVEAADAATVKESLTVAQLSTAVLEGLTGVSREWLSPVRPFFDRLAALAMSKQVTDEDFLAALEKAQTQLPEIFELMDSQALEDAFSNAIGSAALAGSVSRYE
jgi:phage gp29-like protein